MSEISKLVPLDHVLQRGPELVSTCASEINLEPIDWLWPGRIARGKHTCIAGEPGTGKSQLTMSIVAAVTTGGDWPCGEGRSPQGSVIILSAEDGASDTIVPRLHAAEADCGSVQIVTAVREPGTKGRRGVSLQTDLLLLEREIERLGDAALVVIDPVSSYLGRTDSHKNAEVRGVLEPIGEMAERLNVAILSVTHFSKAGAGATTKALHRFIGSIAFVGAPRAAFVVLEDEENGDRRLFLHAKNNLAPPPQGLAFGMKETIVGDPGKGIVASRIVWERDPVSITANEALAAEAGSSNRPASDEAECFLRELLEDGPVPAKQLKGDCDAAGISWATVRRAKGRLGIRVNREGFGPGSSINWALPPYIGAQICIDAHDRNVSTYEENEHLCSQDSQKETAEPTDYPEIPAFLDRRASEVQ